MRKALHWLVLGVICVFPTALWAGLVVPDDSGPWKGTKKYYGERAKKNRLASGSGTIAPAGTGLIVLPDTVLVSLRREEGVPFPPLRLQAIWYVPRNISDREYEQMKALERNSWRLKVVKVPEVGRTGW